MKKFLYILTFILVGGLFLAASSNSWAADNTKEDFKKGSEPGKIDEEKEAAASKPKLKLLVYKPPFRGAPSNRIGGGTRGKKDGPPISIAALVPDHTGLTTVSQPTFYWRISRATTEHIEFVLNNEKMEKTIFKKDLGPASRGGIHSVNLSDYNVKLKPGVEYRWFITFVSDPNQPSKDIFSGGNVKRVKAGDKLAGKLAGASRGEAPFVYADEGVWYDALMELSQLIETSRSSNTYFEQRENLLEQVGLGEIKAD